MNGVSSRPTMFLITPIMNFFQNVLVFSLDFILTIANIILPKRKIGHVVPAGHPGAGGKWPEYVAPKEGDSRSSCPALNALANHGVLPHDGKNIKFKDLGSVIRKSYNFGSTFCFFVPNTAANMLKRSYSKDSFDLAELDLHNGIEHDASLTREDSALVPDQGKPHLPFVRELLATASGKDKDGNALLTIKDLSEYSAKRRVDARKTNKDFTLSRSHKTFGSSNSSTMLTIFGGRIADLETFLTEERLPEGWEPRIRTRNGLTFGTFNLTVFKVEHGINEKAYEEKLAKEGDAAKTEEV